MNATEDVDAKGDSEATSQTDLTIAYVLWVG
jgi:hypothetical protein